MTTGALGDPLGDTGFALCGVDHAGRVVLHMLAPPGSCGEGRCWKRTRHGFRYANPWTPGGLERLSLQVTPNGQARFAAVGRKDLDLPDLPIVGGLAAVLRRSDAPAACWASDLATIVENRPRRFRATGR